jgi:hypothetical protein
MTVEQVDRDAAADILEATGWLGVAERLRKGVVFPSDSPEEQVVLRVTRVREQARAEAIEPLVGAIDAAMTDLDLLRRAIEERDPWAELLIRTTDTWRRLDVAIRSLSAAQGEG